MPSPTGRSPPCGRCARTGCPSSPDRARSAEGRSAPPVGAAAVRLPPALGIASTRLLRRLSSLAPIGPGRVEGQLEPVVDLQLLHQAADVRLDRVLADAQDPGDLRIALPFSHELQHLLLARSQVLLLLPLLLSGPHLIHELPRGLRL